MAKQNDKNIEAYRLLQYYLMLKGMEADLIEIEENHPKAKHFIEVLNKAISELDEVAHLLIAEIKELKKLEE